MILLNVQSGMMILGQAVQNSWASDPYWNFVTSLAHFDTVSGNTSPDEKTTDWELSEVSVLSTSQSRFGEGSLYFDNNNSSFCRRIAGSWCKPGTSDFTIDAWIYPKTG